MNIHEYQAKAILRAFGVPVPLGEPASTIEEAIAAAQRLPGPRYVLKSQIHAGGRGKGQFKELASSSLGGVRVVSSLAEVGQHAGEMLGKTLVTAQTGPEGRVVRTLYIEEALEIERELYLSLLFDYESGLIAFVASAEGGVDIEEAAHDGSGRVSTFRLNRAAGYSSYVARNIVRALKLPKSLSRDFESIADSLYRAFIAKDMTMLEINPFVVTKDGRLVISDAKVGFDPNALYRHSDIRSLRDSHEESPAETKAAAHGLSYISMDGTIGCMVNGAGLAMATLDIIKMYGASPANFLDVGGSASAEQVAVAFDIISNNANVRGILVNIFGGITKCDLIAEGILEAVRKTDLKVPMVVRLTGTNEELGQKMMRESGLAVIPADSLDDAARKIVAVAGG